MQTKEALKIIGGSLSKPSKMPGWSIGLPAKECKTGGKLQKVQGSVCYDCYALKGCYVFKVIQILDVAAVVPSEDIGLLAVDQVSHCLNPFRALNSCQPSILCILNNLEYVTTFECITIITH